MGRKRNNGMKSVERTFTHPTALQRFIQLQRPLLPLRHDLTKVYRCRLHWPPQVNPSGSGRRDALRLPPLYVLALGLCHEAEDLQHKISAMNVPIKSLPLRVSSNGISITQISTPISFVSTRHWR